MEAEWVISTQNEYNGRKFVQILLKPHHKMPQKGHTYTYTYTRLYKIVIAFILRFGDKIVVGCCYSALKYLYKNTKMKMKNARKLTKIQIHTDENREGKREKESEIEYV